MSQRNTAAPAANVGKEKEKPKGSGGKIISIIIIVLLLCICGYESYLLFGGNNFQATLAVITQGRSFLDIADEELLRQKQNVAGERAELDQERQNLASAKTTLDKREKSLNTREEGLAAREADLDVREQAILEPQIVLESFINSVAMMEDASAATMLMQYSDTSKALAAMKGLKDSKRASILNAMVAIDPAGAARFAQELQP